MEHGDGFKVAGQFLNGAVQKTLHAGQGEDGFATVCLGFIAVQFPFRPPRAEASQECAVAAAHVQESAGGGKRGQRQKGFQQADGTRRGGFALEDGLLAATGGGVHFIGRVYLVDVRQPLVGKVFLHMAAAAADEEGPGARPGFAVRGHAGQAPAFREILESPGAAEQAA
jgi:hypothetical protein